MQITFEPCEFMFAMNISPFPRTAMSPASRRSGRFREVTARFDPILSALTMPIIVLIISGANLLTGPMDFAARADSPKRGVRFAPPDNPPCRTGRLGRHSSRAAGR